jgi:hypothetical protein
VTGKDQPAGSEPPARSGAGRTAPVTGKEEPPRSEPPSAPKPPPPPARAPTVDPAELEFGFER